MKRSNNVDWKQRVVAHGIKEASIGWLVGSLGRSGNASFLRALSSQYGEVMLEILHGQIRAYGVSAFGDAEDSDKKEMWVSIRGMKWLMETIVSVDLLVLKSWFGAILDVQSVDENNIALRDFILGKVVMGSTQRNMPRLPSFPSQLPQLMKHSGVSASSNNAMIEFGGNTPYILLSSDKIDVPTAKLLANKLGNGFSFGYIVFGIGFAWIQPTDTFMYRSQTGKPQLASDVISELLQAVVTYHLDYARRPTKLVYVNRKLSKIEKRMRSIASRESDTSTRQLITGLIQISTKIDLGRAPILTIEADSLKNGRVMGFMDVTDAIIAYHVTSGMPTIEFISKPGSSASIGVSAQPTATFSLSTNILNPPVATQPVTHVTQSSPVNTEASSGSSSSHRLSRQQLENANKMNDMLLGLFPSTK